MFVPSTNIDMRKMLWYEVPQPVLTLELIQSYFNFF
jgi:hypothetical protein